jgi:hypothetical protein
MVRIAKLSSRLLCGYRERLDRGYQELHLPGKRAKIRLLKLPARLVAPLGFRIGPMLVEIGDRMIELPQTIGKIANSHWI